MQSFTGNDRGTRNVLALVTVFALAQGTFGQVGMLAAADALKKSSEDPVSMPFVVPQELHEGAVRKFPNSTSTQRIEYTKDGALIAVSYADAETAARDLKALAVHLDSVVADATAGDDACLDHFGGARTLWFRLDALIVGIRGPAAATTEAGLVGLARGVAASYRLRIQERFSTPAKCVATYLDAVQRGDNSAIFECLHNDGTPETVSAIATVRYMMRMLPMIRRASTQHGKAKSVVTPSVGETEMVSANEAKVAIVVDTPVQSPQDAPALFVLTLGPAGRPRTVLFGCH